MLISAISGLHVFLFWPRIALIYTNDKINVIRSLYKYSFYFFVFISAISGLHVFLFWPRIALIYTNDKNLHLR